MREMQNYKEYKWFFTSNNMLVVGGKSAEQNDKLLKEIKKIGGEFVVMHTSSPGSPFSILLCDLNKIKKEDLEECAIFTGCFSRAWKHGKKKAEVHIFNSDQLKKRKGMKSGTWSVSGKVKKVSVKLKLALCKQEGVLRAVPLSVPGRKKLLEICPGKVDKTKMTDEIINKSKIKVSRDDVLSALPAGGVKVC